MSPTRRPSTVAGLRRAVSASPAAAPSPAPAASRPEKPARITLNLPPSLYRELIRWTGTAADALDVPRVTVQQALRGMIREVVNEPALSAKIIHGVADELRGERP